MRKKNETDYDFLCRQVDKCIELLQDLKNTKIIPYSNWSEQEKQKGKIVKSRLKRTRKQINDWLSQSEKDTLELQRLGLMEDETIN
jgi:hypothetical protein